MPKIGRQLLVIYMISQAIIHQVQGCRAKSRRCNACSCLQNCHFSLQELHIIIFDEIDAICKARGSVRDGTGTHDTIVNQLLTKIDGVDALNNILLIGMTNRWVGLSCQTLHFNQACQSIYLVCSLGIALFVWQVQCKGYYVLL